MRLLRAFLDDFEVFAFSINLVVDSLRYQMLVECEYINKNLTLEQKRLQISIKKALFL